jgi:hypothetical protein
VSLRGREVVGHHLDIVAGLTQVATAQQWRSRRRDGSPADEARIGALVKKAVS